MKNFLIILFLLPMLVFGQTPAAPGLFEVVTIKVKKGQEKAFEAAVVNHNKAYHADGSKYHANLYYIVNGPNGGSYTWNMGPTNYTAMDTRPAEGSHDTDWENLSHFIESASSPNYWQTDNKLSSIGTEVTGGKSLVWIYDLKSGKGQDWKKLVGKIKEVYTAKIPTESMGVYWNEFADTKAGNDVAIVFPFSKWAWLDRESKFNEKYDAVHGEGTFAIFLEDFTECINGRVDFLRERID